MTATEEFGIAAVEALAAGRPVIALGDGGVRESVVEGETGTFFERCEPGRAGRGGAARSTRSRSTRPPAAPRPSASAPSASASELKRIVAEAVRDERRAAARGAARSRGLAGVPRPPDARREARCVTDAPGFLKVA